MQNIHLLQRVWSVLSSVCSMSLKFDRFLEDLKNRTDIVEVVRRYAPDLKKSGKNYMCRSPFRNERTPSFCVSPDRQFWYDFGNSEGGDVIRFLEKVENVSFREAIDLLADQAGLDVPAQSIEKSGQTREQKKGLVELHQKAIEFFSKELQKNEKAQTYLKDRGFSPETINQWQLGYGGDDKQALSKYLLQAGFRESQIAESGVAFERSFGDKTMQDRFWGRVMIPICEPRNGDPIAFSGRDILDRAKVGKYVNSPENPLYNKSATLFGLDQARKAIREQDQVILVEGNFDVITLHQSGFMHSVACCGTSLTEDHIRVLKRLTKNFVLAFDTDVAGKKATLRAIEMLLQQDLNPFVIDITVGKDIDEFLQQPAGTEHLKKQIAQPENALSFLLHKLHDKFASAGIEGRKRLLETFFSYLRHCPRPIEIDHFLTETAQLLKTGKMIIDDEFTKYQIGNPLKALSQNTSESTGPKFELPERFLGFLSVHWSRLGATFAAETTGDQRLRQILPADFYPYLDHLQTVELLPEDSVLKLQGWTLKEGTFYEEDPDNSHIQSALNDYIRQLQKFQEQAERAKVLEQLKDL